MNVAQYGADLGDESQVMKVLHKSSSQHCVEVLGRGFDENAPEVVNRLVVEFCPLGDLGSLIQRRYFE